MPQEKTVNTPSESYERMTPKWDKVQTLARGTDAMREAGREYLPQMEGESDLAYDARLKRSVLFNQTKNTVDLLTGKVFKKPISLTEDFNPALESLEFDADRQGRDLNQFARNVFYTALRDRVAGILVDYPNVESVRDAIEEREGSRPEFLSPQQRKDFSVRPYFVHVRARDLIDVWEEYDLIGNKQIKQLRIRESTTQADGEFHRVTVPRVRVIRPNEWALYELMEVKSDGEEIWMQVDGGVNTLGIVPFVPIVFDQDSEDYIYGDLPLENLVDLNILHWQSYSDQENILHYARRFVAFFKGIDSDEKIVWGPSHFIKTSETDADAKILEHSGASIAAGEKAIERLENRMEIIGAEMLAKRPGNQTATGQAIDENSNNSKLGTYVNTFGSAYERAYIYAAMWLKLENPVEAVGAVQLNSNFGITEQEFKKLESLEKARARGDISQGTFLERLKYYSVLSQDLDVTEEITLTENEAESMAGDFGGGFSQGEEEPGEDEENE
jgi:hypothetical protein